MPTTANRFVDLGENPARPGRKHVMPGHWNPVSRAWNASNRPLEAGLAAVIVVPNAWITLPFDSMLADLYAGYLEIMPEVWWGLCGVVAGLLIWAGIYINGAIQASPHLRMMGMILSCGIHTSLAFTWIKNTGPAGIAWIVYATLALLAFYCLVNLSAHRACRGRD